MIYTHSKIIAISIICVSCIVGVFIFKNKNTFGKTENRQIDVEVSKQADVDSDGDGLKDWEESLIGTNPNKKDSDDDGINDDKNFKESFVFTPKNNNSEDLESTITSTVSQKFLLDYFLEKKNNPQLTEEQIQSIAKKAADSILIQPAVDFDIKDIKISKYQTKSGYEKELEDAFKSGFIQKQETEMEILDKALKDSDKKILLKLDPIINSYKTVINSTLNVKVTEDAIGLHLVYLNSLKDVKEDIEQMKNIFNDPVKTYSYVNKYEIDLRKLQIVMVKLSKYFQNR